VPATGFPGGVVRTFDLGDPGELFALDVLNHVERTLALDAVEFSAFPEPDRFERHSHRLFYPRRIARAARYVGYSFPMTR